LLKVFPFVTAPALVRHQRFWPHLIVALCGLVLLTLPYFFFHPSDWQTFRGTNFSSTSGLDPAGNYGVVYLLYLLAKDLRGPSVVGFWQLFYPIFQIGLLTLTSLLVLFSRDDRVAFGVVTMLLAHFLTYVHVWEHHASGMVAALLLLLTVEYEERWLRAVIICALVLLALPTPFVLFNPPHEPLAWAPAWPHYADYLNLLPKVLPVLALYPLCVFKLWKAGFAWPRIRMRDERA
jgi:hypothetical protein